MTLLLATAKGDAPSVTTVLVSALVSAGVAAVVSLLVSVVTGVPLEVRKQRALRGDAARADIVKYLRLQLNSVRLLRIGTRGWSTLDGRVVEFTDSFDGIFDEMHEQYRSSVEHFAAVQDEPEQTVRRAMLAAGMHVMRIRHFRQEAIGKEPHALMAERAAIDEDLATADDLLTRATAVMRAGPVRRRWRLRSLRSRYRQVEALGLKNQAPRTPLNYYVALQRAKASGRWDPPPEQPPPPTEPPPS